MYYPHMASIVGNRRGKHTYLLPGGVRASRRLAADRVAAGPGHRGGGDGEVVRYCGGAAGAQPAQAVLGPGGGVGRRRVGARRGRTDPRWTYAWPLRRSPPPLVRGHPPAHPRPATPTREHQTGGAPTRHAPTRRATHQPRSPPPQHTDGGRRHLPASPGRPQATRAPSAHCPPHAPLPTPGPLPVKATR